MRWGYELELVRKLFAEASPKALVPVWTATIITYLHERRLVLPSHGRAVNYWGLRLDQAILYLTQATNALIARHVPGRPSQTML